jgi:hypothetical protein
LFQIRQPARTPIFNSLTAEQAHLNEKARLAKQLLSTQGSRLLDMLCAGNTYQFGNSLM